jgi:SAM-dependent methyltransferase
MPDREKKYEPFKNSKNVQNMGSPSETGKIVLNYLCSKLDLKSLSGKKLLDIGCGFRFAQAITDYKMEIEYYTGVELDSKLVKYLMDEFSDQRFNFVLADQKNNYYNPSGGNDFAQLHKKLATPYDIISMCSVITHQDPIEASKTLKLARKCVDDDGFLLFTACIHGEGHAPFESNSPNKGALTGYSESHLAKLRKLSEQRTNYMEWDPEKPGLMSGYSKPYLLQILIETNWDCLSVSAPFENGAPVQSAFLCRPAHIR